jgi:integrase
MVQGTTAEIGAYSSLLGANYKTSTQQEYAASLKPLATFLRSQHKLTMQAFMRKSLRATAHLLSRYVAYTYATEHGKYRSRTIKSVYAVVAMRPQLRTHLLVVRRLLSGWEKLVPSKPWPPISYEGAVAIALLLSHWKRPRMGLAVLVAFSALLRCSEVCNLRPCDFLFPGKRYPQVLPGVAILNGKTGKNQWASLVHPQVATLLQHASVPVALQQRLFPWSPDTLRTWFCKARDALGLPQDLVFHSLRHGGATYQCLFLNVSLETLRHRGRWKSIASVERYLQEQRVLLTLATPCCAIQWASQCLDEGLIKSWLKYGKEKD